MVLPIRGFSLIDVFSPCVTFNKVNTYPWFKERVYKLEDVGWDPTDFHQSIAKSFELGDRIPLGVIYRAEQPTYEDGEPAFKKGPLVKQPLGFDEQVMRELIEELM